MGGSEVLFGLTGEAVWRPIMTEMPEARLGWAREDTQYVSIMLSSANLIGPFSGGPRPFWKAAPHSAGRTRRGERRPAAEVVKKLLFPGSVARDDRQRIAYQHLLNNMVGERHNRFRNRTELYEQLPSGPSRELALFLLQLIVLRLSACCVGFNPYTAQVECQSAHPPFAFFHGLFLSKILFAEAPDRRVAGVGYPTVAL
jgi:hypothetical protein